MWCGSAEDERGRACGLANMRVKEAKCLEWRC